MKRSILFTSIAAIFISLGAGCSSSRTAYPPRTYRLSAPQPEAAAAAEKDSQNWLYFDAGFDASKVYHPLSIGTVDFMNRGFSDTGTVPTFKPHNDPSESRVILFRGFRVEIVDATKTWLAALKLDF
jgi:hypothetical protein